MIVQKRTVSLSFSASNLDSRQVLYEEGGASRGMSIYIDAGQLYVGAVNGRTRFYDGAFATGSLFGLAGKLDNLRIYNRVIDEDEVRHLFDLRLLDTINV